MDVELIVGKVENVIPYSPQTIAGIHQRLDRALEADEIAPFPSGGSAFTNGTSDWFDFFN